MKTREQSEFQKLGDRKTGRHKARNTKDTVRLSSPGSSPSQPPSQPVSTLQGAGLHLFEASSYPLKPSSMSRLRGHFSMSHHRYIGHFRACKEDGTGATLGLRLDDPARCLRLARLRPDDQEWSGKHSRVSSFIDVTHKIDKIGTTDLAFEHLLLLYTITCGNR